VLSSDYHGVYKIQIQQKRNRHLGIKKADNGTITGEIPKNNKEYFKGEIRPKETGLFFLQINSLLLKILFKTKLTIFTTKS
jgi:hypothetical protein